MSRRIEKVNKNIKKIFAQILQAESDLPANVLVTVSDVETSRNLQSATVWLSVLPASQEDQILATINQQIYHLQGLLNQQLTINPLPRIKLRLDHGFQHADNIARALADVNK